jgi:hypothetical protein
MNKRILTTIVFITAILVLGINPGLAKNTSIVTDESGITGDMFDIHIAPWFIEELYSNYSVGEHVSMDINPHNGITLISFYNQEKGDLRLARHVGSGGNCGPDDTWQCISIDSSANVGQYNSIATIAAITGPVQHGDQVDPTQSESILPTEHGVGYTISYYDADNGALKYATGLCTDESCSIAAYTIDSGNPNYKYYRGLYTSVKYDSNFKPHIAYYKHGDYIQDGLVYAHYVGDGSGNCGKGNVAGDWQCDEIIQGEGVGMYASLDIDQYDNPVIAYYDSEWGYPYVAKYVGTGGNCGPINNWYCRSVHQLNKDTGRYVSMYLDNDNKIHLAYYNSTDDTLEYAKEEEVTEVGNCGYNGVTGKFEWQCDWIDDMGTSLKPMGIDIAEDKLGLPVIAYQDATDIRAPAALKLARPDYAFFKTPGVPNCGPMDLVDIYHTWYCNLIDGGGADLDEARSVAIGINPAGLATIAYHELNSYPYPPEGYLKIAFQQLQLFLPLIPEEFSPVSSVGVFGR